MDSSEYITINPSNTINIAHLSVPPHYSSDISSILIPKGLILDRIDKLSELIAKDTNGPLKAICVLKGAHVFYAHLMERLKKLQTTDGYSIPLSFEFAKVKSYANDASTGTIQISLTHEELLEFKGKDLLIVEDIVDTGATMVNLIDLIKKYHPASVRVVSLLLKRTSRSNSYVPDYVGFSIPDLFVVGYCLDYNEVFRDLDHISVISEIGMKKYKI